MGKVSIINKDIFTHTRRHAIIVNHSGLVEEREIQSEVVEEGDEDQCMDNNISVISLRASKL